MLGTSQDAGMQEESPSRSTRAAEINHFLVAEDPPGRRAARAAEVEAAEVTERQAEIADLTRLTALGAAYRPSHKHRWV